MKFLKITPAPRLQPYIKQFVILESMAESTYKVFPSPGLVIGFQYSGKLSSFQNGVETELDSAGITGLSDSFKIFGNSSETGTVLVYFTEMGLAFFTSCPANELFNQSVSLKNIFHRQKIADTEEKLSEAKTDRQRIYIVEQFLLSQQKEIQTDKLVSEAVKLIYASGGTIQITELSKQLLTSQSPLEKRFRRLVGTTPKKFASIIRFNTVINNIGKAKTLTEICYEHNFFDQAHFIKGFKQFTGDTPENFRRFL